MNRVSATVALVCGPLAFVAAIPGGAPALVPALVGLVVFALGTIRAGHEWITVGSVFLFGGIVVAGVGGLSPGLALFGTLFVIVGWDAATFGGELDEQLGESADTTRATAAHVAATLAAGGAIAALAYLTAVVSTGLVSPLAAIAIVAGAWLLAMGLEPVADPDVESR